MPSPALEMSRRLYLTFFSCKNVQLGWFRSAHVRLRVIRLLLYVYFMNSLIALVTQLRIRVQ